MTVGVLALQGDFEAHRRMLQACGDAMPTQVLAQVLAVRDAPTLAQCEALVIPGGESTTMSRLCDRYALWQPLQERIANGMGVFGTCAGLILLAHNLSGATHNFPQRTLCALDIDVARNAYGAQVDSFEADVAVPALGEPPVRAVFIRAPQITRVGADVEVLACHAEMPVIVRQGRLLAAAFHPEIAGDARLHRLWLESLSQ